MRRRAKAVLALAVLTGVALVGWAGDTVRAVPGVPAATEVCGPTDSPAVPPSPASARAVAPVPRATTVTVVFAPALAANPAPDTGPVSPPLAALRDALGTTVDAFPGSGRVAVAVTDLETGETVSVGGDRAQLAGCAINLVVLVLAMQDVATGRLALEDVGELVRATIRTSNPATAHELYSLVGGGDVLAGVRRAADAARLAWGIPGIALDHPPGYPGESLSGGSSNLVTAVAMNQVLIGVWRGDLLPPAERAFLLDALAGVYPGLNYLLGTLGGVATVRHKNGFFYGSGGWVDNDAGIVELNATGGTPRAFAMTFLAEAVPELFADVPAGQALAWAAYDYFAAGAQE